MVVNEFILVCSHWNKGKVYQVNNSVTFRGKPKGSEEFLNQMIETLSIIIDRLAKEDLIKWRAKT